MVLIEPLTDGQIERYSRQIIVPGVGGLAQERLLAAHAALVARPEDAAAALGYLAGAGVGRITIHPVGDRAPYAAPIERARDLNPDAKAALAQEGTENGTEDADANASSHASSDRSPARYDLLFALIGDTQTAAAATRVTHEHRAAAAIIARLATPARIAILPAPPPCPLCAGPELHGNLSDDLPDTPGAPAANAGVVAMAAVAEAFKLLAGLAGQQLESTLIDFDGYAARTRTLGREARGERHCICEAPLTTGARS
ncbi:MAG TPA: hypothetical protein VGI29_12780 [Candidatus Binataceae bacterium]|jgi:adenylyltransferase/sulfurtransferase